MREDRSYNALGRGWVFALAFAAILILVPHALALERMDAPDLTYFKVSLVASLWTLSYSQGTNFAGPFTKSEFSLPNILELQWSAEIVLVSVGLFLLVYDYPRRHDQKRYLVGLVIVVIVLFLLYGLFPGYMLDGMFTSGAVPFPLMQLLGSAVVYAKARLG